MPSPRTGRTEDRVPLERSRAREQVYEVVQGWALSNISAGLAGFTGIGNIGGLTVDDDTASGVASPPIGVSFTNTTPQNEKHEVQILETKVDAFQKAITFCEL